MNNLELAEIAYNAYCETTDWKSAITGAPLPPFNQCPIAVQAGWVAAARAVQGHCNYKEWKEQRERKEVPGPIKEARKLGMTDILGEK